MGGASLGTAVDVSSSSEFSGDGSVRRAEQLELRVAATVTDVLPSGGHVELTLTVSVN